MSMQILPGKIRRWALNFAKALQYDIVHEVLECNAGSDCILTSFGGEA